MTVFNNMGKFKATINGKIMTAKSFRKEEKEKGKKRGKRRRRKKIKVKSKKQKTKNDHYKIQRSKIAQGSYHCKCK